jgi:serine/threonine protein kinase
MSSSHPLTDSLVGTTLGDRYQLVRCLGQGSMGVVFEALQQPLNRRCAVKVLLEQLRDNQTLHQRFMREARAVSVLNHPNLVTLYDFGFAPDGRPYLVMEFIEGEQLSARIPYDGMSLTEVIQIIAQTLLGLDHVHRHGIIHRDLKPENIAILPGHGQGPHVKILDFGLAKITDNDGHVALTMTGEVYGTPYYMSPEQGTGSSKITESVDIYSLGVIFFEMLTGHPPFTGKTPVAIITGHVRSPVPPLKVRAGLDVSPELNELVRRCLAKQSQDRFPSARQMLDALVACPEGRLLPVSLLSSLRREDGQTSSSPANPALKGVEVERPSSGPLGKPALAVVAEPPAAAAPPPHPASARSAQSLSAAAVVTASPPITKQAFPNRGAVSPPASPPGATPKPPGLSGGAPKGMLGPSGLLAGRPLSSPQNPAPSPVAAPASAAAPSHASPPRGVPSAQPPASAGAARPVSGGQPAAQPAARSGPVASATPTVELSHLAAPKPLAPGVRTVPAASASMDMAALLAGLSPGGKLPGFF